MKKHIKLDYSFSSENLRVEYYITGQNHKNLQRICLKTGFKDEFLYTAHKFANCS